jgi:peptidoglycan/LPS O-acetylase OafA/YrhL
VSRGVSPRFAHQPALDGVRGAAVALVLLFHQGWLSGGYVGVSVFFTLSGYLITSLGLLEHDETRRLDVGAFYGRRVRRLLPASLACLTGVVVLAWAGVFGGVEHLRRDLWAALAQVYNWVALGNGQSYAQLVGTANTARSPLDHYWSLAIEEQFYWVWPLALVVILRRPARGRLVLIGALTLAAALAAPLIAVVWGPDAAYWATPARLGELLAGALLAVVLHARRSRGPLHPALSWLAPAGAAVILWAAVSWPSATGPAYDGWLPVFALATVALIAGLQVPAGGLTLLLARPAIVALGAVSYGVYLFHWPVYVVVDADRTHLPSVPLFVVRAVLTIGLAALSYRFLEGPIRAARPPLRLVGASAVAACLGVSVVVASVPAAAAPYWMVDTQDAATDSSAVVAAPAPTATAEPSPPTPATAPPTAAPAATAQPTVTSAPPASVLAAAATAPPSSAAPVAPALPAAPARPVRLMIIGDSTAMATSNGLFAWARTHPAYMKVSSSAAPGCGMIPEGLTVGDGNGHWARVCAKVRARFPAQQAVRRPDVVLGLVTLTDLHDRTWSASEGMLTPADPRFVERLVAAYDAQTSAFLVGGAVKVVWVLPPAPLVPGQFTEDMSPDDRFARNAEALRTVVARHPGQAEVVDLPAWLAAQPSMPARPDGLHWSRAASRQIADGLLAPLVVAAALT